MNRVVKPILVPLTRPRGLETLRLIGRAGGEGASRQEIEAGFDLDERTQADPLLRDLLRVRAVTSQPDPSDARRRRYYPTLQTPRMLAIGDGLSAWIARGPLAPDTPLSARAAKLPLRLATTIWIEGLVPALYDRPLTVDELALRLGSSSTRIRHVVDRASEQGLLRKQLGPGGQKRLSTSPFFSCLVPTAARATLYMARAFDQDPDCFGETELHAAFAELLKSITLDRPVDASIALRVLDAAGKDVTLVANFHRGVLVGYTVEGAYTAEIESDLVGWLVFLADRDRSQLSWTGRGARSLLEAIERLTEA